MKRNPKIVWDNIITAQEMDIEIVISLQIPSFNVR